MAGYATTGWTNGTTPAINEDNLGKIEQGLQCALGFDSLQDLRDEGTPTSVQEAFCRGYGACGDGGAGLFYWDSGSTDSDDDGAVLLPTGHVGAGRWVRHAMPIDVAHIGWWGGGSSATASANIAALQAAAAYLLTTGGRLLFGDGTHQFPVGSSVTLPQDPLKFHIQGIGHEATVWAPSTTGSASYMLTFTSGGVASPIFERICVQPTSRGSRAQFMGVDVGKTNHARWIDCHGKWVDGTAWRIERPHNSDICINTYQCGSWTRMEPSVFVCGSTGPQSANDVVISGDSEQDILGWRYENVVNLATKERVKLHGGDSYRVGHFHNCTGKIEILATLGTYDIYGIQISDNTTQTELYPITPFAGYQAGRLDVDLSIMRNWVAQADPTDSNDPVAGMATASEQAVLRIDVDDSVSTVSVSGLITEFNAGGSYEVVPIKFTGAGTGKIDTSRLHFDWEPTNGRIVDERTAPTYPLLEREGPIHVPDVDGEVITGSGKGPIGSLLGLTVGGGTTSGFSSLERKSLWRKMDNTAYGLKSVQHLQPLTVQYIGTVSSDNVSIASGLFPLASQGLAGGGYNTSKANIAILAFSAVGIPAAWDATSGWGLEIYHTATLVATLKLSADTFSSVADDLYPDAVTGVTHSSGTGTMLVFEQGIPFYSSGPLQSLSFILRRYSGGGAPSNLVDPCITAWFEESIYPEP